MSITLVQVTYQLIHTSDPVVIKGTLLGTAFVITASTLIYWAIAALVGILAEFIVGWRLPLGIFGAFVASLLGIWLFTNIIPLDISSGTIVIADVSIPVVKAFLGAIVVVTLWHVLTYPEWRRRHRYYRGYREQHRRRRNYY
ncbi:MAG TPA: hypothetical protein VKX46_22685 [Ktedonobacteraceae bacterium]|nr:hypothetical protein [Ktedonobacteraceae bacterium]